MRYKMKLAFMLFSMILILAACAEKNDQESTHDMAEHNVGNTEGSHDTEHSSMNHSSDGEIPSGLKESTNPKFPVGSKAIINADHMVGMEGSEATIVGAFDTTVYTVSYTPTNGGEPVENHKWVIHEELEVADEAPLEPGIEVTINANHMEGMQGASAVIDSVLKTTVYMVDYTSTKGEKVTNHKWVTESELSEIKK